MVDTQGRLIPLREGKPAENMAIDQALLESVEADPRPVLRLYTWSEPTLSLGYFQKHGDRAEHGDSAGLTCVRRATGGGAIVHHHELTYSIVVPAQRSIDPRKTDPTAAQAQSRIGPHVDLYQRTHLAVANALAEFEIRATPVRLSGAPRHADDPDASNALNHSFLCFQRHTAEDLMVSGYKVLGSAQRKTRHAVLQHGSLLLRASPWAPQLPGVFDLTSRLVRAEEIAVRFAASMGEALAVSWMTDVISETEQRRAGKISVQKFASENWILRR